MNRAFIVTALLALSGVCASATTVGLGTFAVNPQASFLDESSQDVGCASGNLSDCATDIPGGDPVTGGSGPVSALFLNLGTLGVTAGATIQIIVGGSECYSGPCGSPDPADLAGVFDSNNTELASNISPNCTVGGAGVDRLTGSVAIPGLPPQPQLTNNTYLDPYYCGPQDPSAPAYVNTTIPNDFYIPTGAGFTVVVPAGASYLVLGILDSYYADDLGSPTVTLNEIAPPPAVPEPATLGLFGIGAAALFALRRYHSR
jgi:hypothetical protein